MPGARALIVFLTVSAITVLSGCPGATPDVDELFAAVMQRDARQVRRLIRRGADPRTHIGNTRNTVLHIAARNADTEIVEVLLEAGADVNARNNGGATPLHIAVLAGSAEMVPLLAENGADLDTLGLHGKTALGLAAENADLESAQALLKAGADVNKIDSHGRTAMSRARSTGGEDDGENPSKLVRLLSDAGAWHTGNYGGMSPTVALYNACRLADTEKILSLISGGAVDPDATLEFTTAWDLRSKTVIEDAARHYDIDGDGIRPLHWAAAKGLAEAVEALIEAGAAVDAVADRDCTPLDIAIHNDRVQVARVLLKAGANPNRKDEWGSTPMHLATDSPQMLDVLIENGGQLPLEVAIEAGRTGEALRLVEEGQDLDRIVARDSLGYTLRDWALEHEQPEVAKALADRGVGMSMWNALHSGNVAEVERSLRQGEDPNGGAWHESWLWWAVSDGQIEAARVLLNHGARINDEGPYGRTALDLAIEREDTKMIRFLRANGAKRGSGEPHG